MGRPPKRTGTYRKAKMLKGAAMNAELIQAMHIWKNVLNLDKKQFKEDPLMDERMISIKTWEGCSSYEYSQNKDLYKRWNDRVIEYWRAIDDRCRITRINDIMPTAPRASERVTRICKSDRVHAVQKVKHKASIAAGVAVSAVRDNEIFGLKQNVGKMIADKAYTKIQALPGITEKRKVELAAEMAITQAVAIGEQVGRENIVNDLLGHFDMRPALIAADEKNGDEYSEEAKKRRKEVKKDENK